MYIVRIFPYKVAHVNRHSEASIGNSVVVSTFGSNHEISELLNKGQRDTP